MLIIMYVLEINSVLIGVVSELKSFLKRYLKEVYIQNQQVDNVFFYFPAFFTHQTGPWEPAVRMYRGMFIVILDIFLLGINTYGWRSSGVNHVLIFEIDPRHHLTHQQLMEVTVPDKNKEPCLGQSKRIGRVCVCGGDNKMIATFTDGC